MRYIIFHESPDVDFVCRLGNDGKYHKVAIVLKNEDAGDLVRSSNMESVLVSGGQIGSAVSNSHNTFDRAPNGARIEPR